MNKRLRGTFLRIYCVRLSLAISTILACAAIALGIHSHTHTVVLMGAHPPASEFGAWTQTGRLVLFHRTYDDGDRRRFSFPSMYLDYPGGWEPRPPWWTLGIAIGHPPALVPETDVFIPLWLIAVICATMAAYLLFNLIRRRHPFGYCQACGYDLRGGHDKCPECGTPLALNVINN
jgi:hypothetical protein